MLDSVKMRKCARGDFQAHVADNGVGQHLAQITNQAGRLRVLETAAQADAVKNAQAMAVLQASDAAAQASISKFDQELAALKVRAEKVAEHGAETVNKAEDTASQAEALVGVVKP